jgi:hypothetical protein
MLRMGRELQGVEAQVRNVLMGAGGIPSRPRTPRGRRTAAVRPLIVPIEGMRHRRSIIAGLTAGCSARLGISRSYGLA